MCACVCVFVCFLLRFLGILAAVLFSSNCCSLVTLRLLTTAYHIWGNPRAYVCSWLWILSVLLQKAFMKFPPHSNCNPIPAFSIFPSEKHSPSACVGAQNEEIALGKYRVQLLQDISFRWKRIEEDREQLWFWISENVHREHSRLVQQDICYQIFSTHCSKSVRSNCYMKRLEGYTRVRFTDLLNGSWKVVLPIYSTKICRYHLLPSV